LGLSSVYRASLIRFTLCTALPLRMVPLKA
jgi:hypothetical protein